MYQPSEASLNRFRVILIFNFTFSSVTFLSSLCRSSGMCSLNMACMDQMQPSLGKMAGYPFCIIGNLLHTLMVIIISLMASSDTYHALTWQLLRDEQLHINKSRIQNSLPTQAHTYKLHTLLTNAELQAANPLALPELFCSPQFWVVSNQLGSQFCTFSQPHLKYLA